MAKRAMAALKAGITMHPSEFQVYSSVTDAMEAFELLVMHLERSKFAEVFQADSEVYGSQ